MSHGRYTPGETRTRCSPPQITWEGIGFSSFTRTGSGFGGLSGRTSRSLPPLFLELRVYDITTSYRNKKPILMDGLIEPYLLAGLEPGCNTLQEGPLTVR